MEALRSSRIRTFAVVTILLVCTFALGWFSSRFETISELAKNTAQPVRYSDPEYPFISPLVSVAIPNATGFPELTKAKNDVQNIIDSATKKGSVSSVGVYFRLPINAHWFGIHENDRFDPGSLIKVPVMLAYLREAVSNPAILKSKFYYNARNNDPLPNALPAQLATGSYSASQLLEAMIMDSDNIAKDVLTDHLSEKAISDVFDETNSDFLRDPTGTISPKQYIIILARIYNATYLDRFYSNYAMELLSKTTFRDGLVAGVPKDVKIAHKYGERGIYEDGALTAVELHDCGLVYAETPYYLCVMTKGSDKVVLEKVIQDISKAVYNDRNAFTPTK